jgi:hypothetical protein
MRRNISRGNISIVVVLFLLGALFVGMYAVKNVVNLKPRAANPTTPSDPPTPTLTPPANQFPVLTTTSLPNGRIGKQYRKQVSGYDVNVNDNLAMAAFNLPPGLSFGNCSQNIVNNQKVINCAITGTPTTAGNYTVVIRLTDPFGGSEQVIPLKVN